MVSQDDVQPVVTTMTTEEIEARIAELEAKIAPIQKVLTTLKRKLSAKKAGQASGEARRKNAEVRNARIQRCLDANSGDLYRRPDGLVKRIAKNEEVSVRTVSAVRNRNNRKQT